MGYMLYGKAAQSTCRTQVNAAENRLLGFMFCVNCVLELHVVRLVLASNESRCPLLLLFLFQCVA